MPGMHPLKEVPLVISFTPNYFIPAATWLQSVLKNSNKNSLFHVICLLSENLPDKLKECLIKVDTLNRVSFTFINLEKKLQDVYVDKRYTIAASYRLLLPELLPQYDKVIYSDCDMIIRNDLAKLYHSVDLQDKYLGVVFESPLDFQEKNIRQLGCTPGFYFNSGFLLMNLKKLREDNMTPKFIEALKTDYLEFPDQDVLNVLCKRKVQGLPPYYNSIRTFYIPKYKVFFLKKYTEADWKSIWQHGNIHYTGDKPWNRFTVEFDVWWKYYWQLPQEVRKMDRYNKKMNALYRLYSTRTGKYLFEGIRSIYRKLK